jgi:hypothetical protein
VGSACDGLPARDLSARGDHHEVISHCLTGGVLDHRVQIPGPSPDGKAA